MPTLTDKSDGQLVRLYSESKSGSVFAELVARHAHWIYSCALREAHNLHMAEDIVQAVFLVLAQKAPTLAEDIPLNVWLFRVTHYAAVQALRAEGRRKRHERTAASMNPETSGRDAESIWQQVRPRLDELVRHLREKDRQALLLRFYQQKSMAEVGAALNVSEDAAKKRVAKAVERLRSSLRGTGIPLPAAALTASLIASTTHTAPASVVASCVAAATSPGSKEVLFIAKRTVSAMLTAKNKLTALVTFLLVTLIAAASVTAYLLFGGSDSQPTSEVPPAPTPIIAAAPENEPTTQPFSQNTPLDTLAKLDAALQFNNHTAIVECLCDDGTDPKSAGLARDFFLLNANICQIQKTWQSKFNVPMHVPGMKFDLFAAGGGFEMLLDRLLKIPNGPTVRIEGDVARVRVDLPPEIFAGTGNDRNVALGHWAGATLFLKRVGDIWKVDTDLTLNLAVTVNRRPGNNEDVLVLKQKILEDLSESLHKIAAEINNGSMKYPQEAADAVQNAQRHASDDTHTDGDSLIVLPVVGG
ncbi:MAG TPA: sigma-70 family RNA polymerase sigma factor [Tepidisphaeraceae bacterium]|jgi:RNA polymerase sigma factor (sigma-70 family)|nr:sigma-70 family RNA polymerase sigma factor [Tepidisphaeraceae bacterium]